MPIELNEPVTQPEVVYPLTWLFRTSTQTINFGQPNQSVALMQEWRAYRILPDGSYDFHPTWRQVKQVPDVYALAATDPVVAQGITDYVQVSNYIRELPQT